MPAETIMPAFLAGTVIDSCQQELQQAWDVALRSETSCDVCFFKNACCVGHLCWLLLPSEDNTVEYIFYFDNP